MIAQKLMLVLVLVSVALPLRADAEDAGSFFAIDEIYSNADGSVQFVMLR